ncbi:VENN motif pre-toxin domain-containing protein, partial [Neisseria meningitidis]|uniref:VENN motif pre-toxin domain-containing protein n=1 Tax=Neisseria meningitidis TaxID=487 RepID=UPI0016159035
HSGSLKNTFNKEAVQSELDLQRTVSQDFSKNVQQANTEINQHLDKLKADKEAAETAAAEALANGDMETAKRKVHEAQDAAAKADNWQQGKVILNMLASGLAAPTQSGAGIAAATASPAVSYAIGQHFKDLAGQNANGKLTASQETAHVLAHAVLGAAVAAAGGNNALAGALSAGGSEAAAPYISKWLYGKEKGSDLTAEEKETVTAITNVLGTATGAAVGNSATDAAQGSLNAKSAVGNNDTVEQVKFALRHPRIAIAIGSVHKDPGSTLEPNISTIASTFQLNLFPNSEFGGEGGVGNAFRHVLWQATITREFGKDIAVKVGNSHESGEKINYSIRRNLSLDKADEMIDQLNNEIGREIALNTNRLNTKELVGLILETYKNNGFYQAERNSNGNYDVVRKRLSEKDYQNTSNILIHLDNTDAGFKIQQRRKQIRAQISARQWRR